jgi:hypothetical protein
MWNSPLELAAELLAMVEQAADDPHMFHLLATCASRRARQG